MIDTCLNCKDRKLFCHDNCEKYSNFKKQKEKINKKYRQYMDGRGHDGCLTPKSGRRKKYAQTRF